MQKSPEVFLRLLFSTRAPLRPSFGVLLKEAVNCPSLPRLVIIRRGSYRYSFNLQIENDLHNDDVDEQCEAKVIVSCLEVMKLASLFEE